MNINQIKEKIVNNEAVIIPINNVDLENSLKLLNLQLNSCQSLFNSYINSTIESANNFNLEKFLEKYFSYNLKFQDIILSVLHNAIGKEMTDVALYSSNPKRAQIVNDFKDILIN